MTTSIVSESASENETNWLEITEKIGITILLVVSLVTTFLGLSQDVPFWDWAWSRHLNPLSWIIRPLFIPLYVYFAYRKNIIGVITTVIGIITSMYWFASPASPNADIIHFLDQEQLYLTTVWTTIKILWSSLVPISMIALAVAFWKHSMTTGIAVINIIAFLKITWSVTEDPASGWILIPFALIGLAFTDILVVFFARRKGINLLPKKIIIRNNNDLLT